MLRTAYPASGREMRAWLANPIGSIAGLSLWSAVAAGGTDLAPKRQVRVPKSVDPAA